MKTDIDSPYKRRNRVFFLNHGLGDTQTFLGAPDTEIVRIANWLQQKKSYRAFTISDLMI